MEIAPNKIRGGLIIFQAVWSNVGGIIVSVMMQQLNQKHPDDYLLAMRILWAPIGAMILCWAFIPESPWFHARRGNKEGAMKSLKQLYGNVDGYNFEEEYAIIERTIEHEQEMLAHKPSYADVFRGVNKVSQILEHVGRDILTTEKNVDHHASQCLWTAWWTINHQHILDL